MPHQGPLQWLDGEGWLILLGGGDWRNGETDAVDAQLLTLANLDRPMVVIIGDGSPSLADDILEHYTLLGGPGGQAFSLQTMTRDQLQTQAFLSLLEEAGILYLGGENPLPLVNNLHGTPALRTIVQGYSTLQGLNIIGVGAGAAALGRWVLPPAPPYQQIMGFGFLLNAVVASHFTTTEETPILRALPQIDSALFGLGIPDATALVLGPDGQLETWGSGQVTAVVSANEREE